MAQGVSDAAGPRPLVVAHTLSAPPWRRIGAELATVRLLEHLAGEGWTCVVVPHSVRWPAGESTRRIAPGVLAASSALAMAARPALVYAHVPFVDKAQRQAQRAGAPLVLAAHGGPPGWLAAKVGGYGAALLVANSETMATSLRRTGLPVHVQIPPVHPADTAGLGPTSGGCVTLVNGSKDKGGEIVAALAQRMPDVSFLVVEGGYGETAGALRHLPNVEVLAHGADMVAVWRRTAVLVVPSAEESWGMVAVEAMSAGIPVIGSRVPGLSECLGAAMPQLVPNDLGGWSAAIRDALGDGRERLRAAALRRSAELDPTEQLRSTHRRLAGLIGWDIP